LSYSDGEDSALQYFCAAFALALQSAKANAATANARKREGSGSGSSATGKGAGSAPVAPSVSTEAASEPDALPADSAAGLTTDNGGAEATVAADSTADPSLASSVAVGAEVSDHVSGLEKIESPARPSSTAEAESQPPAPAQAPAPVKSSTSRGTKAVAVKARPASSNPRPIDAAPSVTHTQDASGVTAQVHTDDAAGCGHVADASASAAGANGPVDSEDHTAEATSAASTPGRRGRGSKRRRGDSGPM
jgi:hypothetical protein